ncbi:DUF1534 domain-containing protein [Pseudomonas moraviensis]|nr:DUF1534 domain-containing protein [Pseudomonas moraviensis]
MIATPPIDRSRAPRGNASRDAPRSSFRLGRRASRAAFPRGAWERSSIQPGYICTIIPLSFRRAFDD